jgi:hypothetical protein
LVLLVRHDDRDLETSEEVFGVKRVLGEVLSPQERGAEERPDSRAAASG